MFSWIPIHEEAARQIVERAGTGDDLLAALREMASQGCTVISLDDKGSNGEAS